MASINQVYKVAVDLYEQVDTIDEAFAAIENRLKMRPDQRDDMENVRRYITMFFSHGRKVPVFRSEGGL